MNRNIAYFSMEIALHPQIPTYSGGLGVLAGDTLRSAADLGVRIVGVTLLARKGYFHQRIDADGKQTEEDVRWDIEKHLTDSGARTTVKLEGRDVHVQAWRFNVAGETGATVPVFLLDTDLPENDEEARKLTDHLYGGGDRYRLCQEAILGYGGVRILNELGYNEIETYHMNEGHSALLTMELLGEEPEGLVNASGQQGLDAINHVREKCVFTTHTPVPAGHDRFPLDLVESVIGPNHVCSVSKNVCQANELNMTHLALSMSGYVNGVARRHSEVSREMFAEYKVDAITNGVHAGTWVSQPFAELFDEHIAGWREDNFSLRYALMLSNQDIWEAHQKAQKNLIAHIYEQTGIAFDENVLTLGFARRSTAYKRATLLVSDVERLLKISRDIGKIQIVYAGKAHPKDLEGKRLIKEIVGKSKELNGEVPIVYLPNYEMTLAHRIVAGVDIWVNTPEPPHEASGTSGMKAAMNGVPSLSVLDGWWIEGCIEGLTGWAIGTRNGEVHDANAASLYEKLEKTIVPMYYNDRDRFIDVMRHAIAINGSFYNTQRMVHEYVEKAYSYTSSQRFTRT